MQLAIGKLTWICNSHSQELLQDIADNLDRMTARLVADWIMDKELRRRQNRLLPDLNVVMLEVR